MDGMDTMDGMEEGMLDFRPVFKAQLEGLLRVAARDGIVAGLRLAEPEMAWAKAAFYGVPGGEIERLVEEIVGGVLGADAALRAAQESERKRGGGQARDEWDG